MKGSWITYKGPDSHWTHYNGPDGCGFADLIPGSCVAKAVRYYAAHTEQLYNLDALTTALLLDCTKLLGIASLMVMPIVFHGLENILVRK